MSFVGTWRAELTISVSGGTDDSIDTLEINTTPAVGVVYSMSRHETVTNIDIGGGRRGSFMTDGVIKFTVKSVSQLSFTCSVSVSSCVVSHSTFGNFQCGAPPPNPDVTFTLATSDSLTTGGFPQPETFKRVTSQNLAAAGFTTRRFTLWSREIT
jgi:hypothetical protein